MDARNKKRKRRRLRQQGKTDIEMGSFSKHGIRTYEHVKKTTTIIISSKIIFAGCIQRYASTNKVIIDDKHTHTRGTNTPIKFKRKK